MNRENEVNLKKILK